MTVTAYAGRHRRLSAADFHVTHIVAKFVHTSILVDGTLYVSLADASTLSHLGIDFEGDDLDRLRRALRVAS